MIIDRKNPQISGIEKEKCSFCNDDSPIGMWSTYIDGGSLIFCCHECAVNKLPAFMADSLRLNHHHQASDCAGLFKKIMASFWRAVAFRIQDR